jgi:hypothetical protein
MKHVYQQATHHVYRDNQQGFYQELEQMIQNHMKILPCGKAGCTRKRHDACRSSRSARCSEERMS